MEKSMLRHVQLGHGNEMSLVRDSGEHSDYSFSGSPPGMVASITPTYLERTWSWKRIMTENSFLP